MTNTVAKWLRDTNRGKGQTGKEIDDILQRRLTSQRRMTEKSRCIVFHASTSSSLSLLTRTRHPCSISNTRKEKRWYTSRHVLSSSMLLTSLIMCMWSYICEYRVSCVLLDDLHSLTGIQERETLHDLTQCHIVPRRERGSGKTRKAFSAWTSVKVGDIAGELLENRHSQ